MILPGNLKDFATRTLHEDNMLQFQNILQCIFLKICEADNASARFPTATLAIFQRLVARWLPRKGKTTAKAPKRMRVATATVLIR